MASHLAKRRCGGKYPSPAAVFWATAHLPSSRSMQWEAKRETIFCSNNLRAPRGSGRTKERHYRPIYYAVALCNATFVWFCCCLLAEEIFLAEEMDSKRSLAASRRDALLCGKEWECVERRWLFRAPDRCRKLVEAGGVEPPSEKRYGHEAYMLISIRCATRPLRADRAFAGGAWNEQDAQPTSPMVLARALRTERSKASSLCDASCRAHERSPGKRALN